MHFCFVFVMYQYIVYKDAFRNLSVILSLALICKSIIVFPIKNWIVHVICNVFHSNKENGV